MAVWMGVKREQIYFLKDPLSSKAENKSVSPLIPLVTCSVDSIAGKSGSAVANCGLLSLILLAYRVIHLPKCLVCLRLSLAAHDC